ncbi:MAG TPA: hypothetical protein VIH90_07420 [Candidatus Saccharimonadales bacterium]
MALLNTVNVWQKLQHWWTDGSGAIQAGQDAGAAAGLFSDNAATRDNETVAVLAITLSGGSDAAATSCSQTSTVAVVALILSDSTVTSDSFSDVIARIPSQIDTSATSDALSTAITGSASLSDTKAQTDSLISAEGPPSQVGSDSSATFDSITGILIFALSDSIVISDTDDAIIGGIPIQNLNDSAVTADVCSTGETEPIQNFTDAVSTSGEVFSSIISTSVEFQADSTTTSDSVISVTTGIASLNDSIVTGDMEVGIVGGIPTQNLSDSVVTSDSETNIKNIALSVSDSANMSDSAVSVAVTAFAVSDLTVTGDVEIGIVGGIPTQNLSDSVVTSDSETNTQTVTILVSDSMTISDSEESVDATALVINESVATSDSETNIKNIALSVSDSSAMFDNATFVISMGKVNDDSAMTSDNSVGVGGIPTQSVSDSTTTGDIEVNIIGGISSISDSATTSDSVISVVSRLGISSDSIATSDNEIIVAVVVSSNINDNVITADVCSTGETEPIQNFTDAVSTSGEVFSSVVTTSFQSSSDSVTTSDIAIGGNTKLISDIVTTTDSVITIIGVSNILSDSATTTDNMTIRGTGIGVFLQGNITIIGNNIFS